MRTSALSTKSIASYSAVWTATAIVVFVASVSSMMLVTLIFVAVTVGLGCAMLWCTSRDGMLTANPAVPYRTLTVALLFSSTDFFGWASQGPAWRYGLIIPAMCIAGAADGRARRRFEAEDSRGEFPAGEPLSSKRYIATNVLLLLLFSSICLAYLIIGTLVGNFNKDNYTVAMPPAILAAYGVSYLLTKTDSHVVPGEINYREVLRADAQKWGAAFSVIALFYSLLALYNAAAAPFGSPPTFANHETLFILVAICLLAVRLKSAIVLVSVAAAIASTVKYPTATLLLICITGALLAVLCRLVAGQFLKIAVMVAGPAVALFYLYAGQRIVELFYAKSSRTSNSSTRELLWSQGISTISKNIVLGGHGVQTITASAIINGKPMKVPLHNSILTLGVYGGMLAISAFILLIAYGAWCCVRNIAQNGLGSLGPLIALVALTISLLFNPALDKLAVAICLYATMLWVLTQAPTRSDGESCRPQRTDDGSHMGGRPTNTHLDVGR